MKTTAGKTKTVRPKSRPIRIYIKNGKSWRMVAVKKCSTLKQALTEFYTESLKDRGYTHPLYNGNMLTTTIKGRDSVYIALEVTQEPVDDRH